MPTQASAYAYREVPLNGVVSLQVASPLDLMRVERARGQGHKVLALAAVLEHRRRDLPFTPAGFPEGTNAA